MTRRIAASTVALLLLIAPAVRADVGPSVRIPTPAQVYVGAAIAANERGDRVVAYSANDRGIGIAFSPHGHTAFTRPRLVPGSANGDLSSVDVRISPSGVALVSWIDTEYVYDDPTDYRGGAACCAVAKAVVVQAHRRLPRPIFLTPPDVQSDAPTTAIRDGKHFA